MTARIVLRSLVVVAIGAVVSWPMLMWIPSLVEGFDHVSQALFWSVPFVLATALATFNNMLRVFDRIEKVIEQDFRGLSADQKDKLLDRVESTEALTAALLHNALIAIIAGLMYFVVGGLEAIAWPTWYPEWVRRARPDLIAASVRFGLALLPATILVVQFLAIPPMVSFYRFFAVDRHLPLLEGGEQRDRGDAG